MTTQCSSSRVVCLFRYSIASSDMYYAEMEQRDVKLGLDEKGQFRIWGETTGGSPSTTIGMCDVFLEYAMYCRSWCDLAEALYHMQDFGERLGKAVAEYIKEDATLPESDNFVIRALEGIFKIIDGCPIIEHCGSETRFIIPDHPLEEAAEHSGLRDIEIAHHGINAMCQSLIRALNPNLLVNASPENQPEFAFTIMTPMPA